MPASLDEVLLGLSLDQSGLQTRLQRSFGMLETIQRADEPVPLDHLVPSAAFTSGAPQLMPFRRSQAGWAMVQTADPAGAELSYSLDRLPYGAIVTGARLSYITDATFPNNTNVFGLYSYDKRAGTTTAQRTVPIPRSATVQTLALAFPQPITVGAGTLEPIVQVVVTAAVAAATFFVRGLFVAYSYSKAARPS